MTTSTNLGLALHGTGTLDTAVTFQNWRKAINGIGDDSNMQLIDKAYGEMSESIDTLETDVNGLKTNVSHLITQTASLNLPENIASVTLFEAANAVSISRDTSGSTFTLSDFIIKIYNPGAAENSNIILKFSDNGTPIVINAGLTTVSRCTTVYFTKCKTGYDVRFDYNTTKNLNAGSSSISGHLFDMYTECNTVSDIRVYTGTGKTLPAGTIVSIIGVRV